MSESNEKCIQSTVWVERLICTGFFVESKNEIV